jgi:hypothetical protein
MLSDKNRKFKLKGHWNVDNIKKWTKKYHEGGYFSLREDQMANPWWDRQQCCSVLTAFNIVRNMFHSPWTLVEKVLDDYFQGLEEKKGYWSWGRRRHR